MVVGANNAIALNGSFSYTGSSSLDLGTGAVTISSGNKFVTVSANSLTLGGSMSGAGSIQKQGNGTLVLKGNNTFSGGIILDAGALHLGHANALGSRGLTRISGGTLDNTSGAALTLASNAWEWNGNFTFTGTKDLDMGAGAVSLVAAAADRRVTVNGGALTIGGVISNSAAGGIRKEGAGSLILSGLSTYTGTTSATGGRLIVQTNVLKGQDGALGKASSAVSLANAALLSDGGYTLDRDITTTGDAGIGGLKDASAVFSGNVSLAKTLTIEQAVTTGTNKLTVSGNITGATGSTKTVLLQGPGKMDITGVISNGAAFGSTVSLEVNGADARLSGNSTFTGSTKISSGLLYMDGTHIGAGQYDVDSGGMLSGSGSITTVDANIVINSGGKLGAGSRANSGTLSLNLGTGGLGIFDAAATEASQSLLFRLGVDEFSNAFNDKIVLSNPSSFLAIGLGTLEFNDFVFTLETSLGIGVHSFTLFETSQAIAGTFGDGLTGYIGGNLASIGFGDAGSDIILTVNVIPEPGAVPLVGLGIVLAGVLGRRQRKICNGAAAL